MKMTCLIVDDEPMARKGLADDLILLAKDIVTVQGLAGDAGQARTFLKTCPVDLLFLDIEMPGSNGLDLLAGLTVKPMVILVTAYPQYALHGYEHGVIDYLLKPFAPARLRLACEKALEWHDLRSRGEPTGGVAATGHLYVKCNGKFERLSHADILYLEAANNYVMVHTPGRKYMVYETLKGLAEQLPAQDFIQVHKSFIVARKHIRQVNGNTILLDQTKIPLSRRCKSAVIRDVVGKK